MSDEIDEQELPGGPESRRLERLEALPVVYRRNDERMALELVLLAADGDPWSVIQSYGYDREQAAAVLSSPAFARLLAAARKDVDENGVGFVAKARLQAEVLLQDSFDMATDPYVAAPVRADLIKWTAAVAGLGPKKDADKGTGTGGGFNISITFAQPRAAPTEVQGITLEHEV